MGLKAVRGRDFPHCSSAVLPEVLGFLLMSPRGPDLGSNPGSIITSSVTLGKFLTSLSLKYLCFKNKENGFYPGGLLEDSGTEYMKYLEQCPAPTNFQYLETFVS